MKLKIKKGNCIKANMNIQKNNIISICMILNFFYFKLKKLKI